MFFQLLWYVFRNLHCILTRRVYIVPSAPKLPDSILILKGWKLLVYHQATFAFEIPHKARHRHFRRYLQQHMHMIRAYFRFDLSLYPSTHTAFLLSSSYAIDFLCRSFLDDLLLPLGCSCQAASLFLQKEYFYPHHRQETSFEPLSGFLLTKKETQEASRRWEPAATYLPGPSPAKYCGRIRA